MTILFKRILIISSVIYILLFGGLCVCAEEIPTPDETRQTLSEYVDFYGDIFENGINDLEDKNMFSDAIDDFNIKSIMNKLNSGELSVSPSGILNTIIRLLLGEVYSAAGLMATVLAVSVLGSYLQGLKDGCELCILCLLYRGSRRNGGGVLSSRRVYNGRGKKHRRIYANNRSGYDRRAHRERCGNICRNT